MEKDILTGFTLLLASWRPRQLVREVCDAYESLNEGTVSLPSVSAFICQIKLDFIRSNNGTSYHKPLLYLYPVSMEHESKNKERFENRRHSWWMARPSWFLTGFWPSCRRVWKLRKRVSLTPSLKYLLSRQRFGPGTLAIAATAYAESNRAYTLWRATSIKKGPTTTVRWQIANNLSPDLVQLVGFPLTIYERPNLFPRCVQDLPWDSWPQAWVEEPLHWLPKKVQELSHLRSIDIFSHADLLRTRVMGFLSSLVLKGFLLFALLTETACNLSLLALVPGWPTGSRDPTALALLKQGLFATARVSVLGLVHAESTFGRFQDRNSVL